MKAGPALGTVALLVLVASCAHEAAPGPITPAPGAVAVELRDLPARAKELDGRRVTTYGLALVSESSLNLVSQKKVEGQTCVGLLIRQDALAALKKHDHQWRQVTGTLEAEGCGRDTVCFHSCGPAAIRDPEFSAR